MKNTLSKLAYIITITAVVIVGIAIMSNTNEAEPIVTEVRTPHEHHLINGDVYYVVAREHINNRGAGIKCITWSFVVTSENTELAIELPNVREYLAFLQYMSHPAMMDEIIYQHAIQFFMARYAVSNDY